METFKRGVELEKMDDTPVYTTSFGVRRPGSRAFDQAVFTSKDTEAQRYIALRFHSK